MRWQTKCAPVILYYMPSYPVSGTKCLGVVLCAGRSFDHIEVLHAGVLVLFRPIVVPNMPTLN